MEKLLKLFPFLGSTRFWAVVLIALSILLSSYGLIPDELKNFVLTIAGGHIGIRSWDRGMESLGGQLDK